LEECAVLTLNAFLNLFGAFTADLILGETALLLFLSCMRAKRNIVMANPSVHPMLYCV